MKFMQNYCNNWKQYVYPFQILHYQSWRSTDHLASPQSTSIGLVAFSSTELYLLSFVWFSFLIEYLINKNDLLQERIQQLLQAVLWYAPNSSADVDITYHIFRCSSFHIYVHLNVLFTVTINQHYQFLLGVAVSILWLFSKLLWIYALHLNSLSCLVQCMVHLDSWT